MTDFQLIGPADPIQRDRYGRPLIKPRDGKGKPVAFQRATTFAGLVEDTYNLGRWQQRQVIVGLVDRPDLLMAAAAHRDDRNRLNEIAEQAAEAAKAHAAATIGTALHSLCEQLDRGVEPASVPSDYRADLDAYRRATAGMEHLHIERMVVLDDLKVAGTPDRVVEYKGRRYIFDIKTGGLDYGQGKIATQLALYAHGDLYDPATGQRSPLAGVDRKLGIVAHLPAGAGTCSLHWVDLEAGWSAVPVIGAVKDWRATKGLLELISDDPIKRADGGVYADDVPDLSTGDDLLAAVREARSLAELEELWRDAGSRWTDLHTGEAVIRKAVLALDPLGATPI